MTQFPFNLDQLIIFKTIVKEGSFKKASKKLYLSQPAISFQIRNLEKRLNILLFKREKKKIYLTKAGYILLRYTNRILRLCEETFHSLKIIKNINYDQINLGASQTIGTYLIPYIIGVFHYRYPQIKVCLYIYSIRRLSWYVITGKINLAIIEGKIPLELKDLIYIIPYTEEEFVLILPGYPPFSNLKKIKKNDLYNFKFLSLESKSLLKKLIDKLLLRNNINLTKLKIKMELNSLEGIKNAIQAGLGVSFLPISSITKELNLQLIHQVKVDSLILKQPLFIISNPYFFKSKSINFFMEEILAIFLNL